MGERTRISNIVVAARFAAWIREKPLPGEDAARICSGLTPSAWSHLDEGKKEYYRKRAARMLEALSCENGIPIYDDVTPTGTIWKWYKYN